MFILVTIVVVITIAVKSDTINTYLEKRQVKEKQVDIPVVSLFYNNDNISIDVEKYLLGVVGSEMPASFEIEALKAQAVAARTYVMHRNLQVDATTSSQVYRNEEKLKEVWGSNFTEYYKKVKEAVTSTKGEVMKYDNQIIGAYFFSSSNGYTNNVEDYWNKPLPYLKSVESKWEEKYYSSFEVTIQMNKMDFVSKVNSSSNPSISISRFQNHYVKRIIVDNKSFTGKEFRELLTLRSSDFDIVDRGSYYDITTRGSGHGIGMSQWGAQGMAKEGFKYKDILKYYYTDIDIINMYKQ